MTFRLQALYLNFYPAKHITKDLVVYVVGSRLRRIPLNDSHQP